MRIAIVYVCTGKYLIFWEDFYKSAEKNFIPGSEKHYFVFTDADQITFEDKPNVEKIHQENLGWPYNTLMRYKMFGSISDKLAGYDYIFFFNANISFVKPIRAEDFLPREKEKFVAVVHSGYADAPASKKPFESRKASKAFMAPQPDQLYFQGAVNGGIGKNFLEAIKEMGADIEEDLRNNIIAAWWDESHWNRYLAQRLDQVRILPPPFLCPEGVNVDYEPIILLKEKSRYGGHLFLRKEHLSMLDRLAILKTAFKTRIKRLLKTLTPGSDADFKKN